MRKMVKSALTRAWIALLLLSGGSTLVAALVTRDAVPIAASVAILTLSWLKARVILSRYLGLWQAPTWRAGFDTVLAIYCVILIGLYLVPVLSA